MSLCRSRRCSKIKTSPPPSLLPIWPKRYGGDYRDERHRESPHIPSLQCPLAGSCVRGPASRAEGNGPLLIPNRSVSVPSACSAGPLTLMGKPRFGGGLRGGEAEERRQALRDFKFQISDNESEI